MMTLVSASPKPPFSAFLEQHRTAVLAFLRSMVGPVDADDAFQETFLAALRAYESLDGENPRAWLLTIARNKAIDQHRASARRPLPAGDDLPETASADPPPVDDAIWARVAELPQRQREAVALRYGADLAYREVGKAMDTSADAARRNVHEGLKKLRATIEEER